MPINSTLATRLPAACNLKVDASQCSGVGVPVPPSHAGHQVSLGSNTNATIAGMQICFTPCILCLLLWWSRVHRRWLAARYMAVPGMPVQS
ncbi:uncharacterized protein LOC102622889 isoform X2 [Citrus sinensis]|nr:uncharacterized protein LOC102622889 isoform X2 [Citrus sinensis]